MNVLTWPGGPTVAELGAAGVRRISVGGALSYVAMAAVGEAAHELLDQGTLAFLERARMGRSFAHAAFT